MERTPQRLSLEESDLLYFLHVPRAGGTSFWEFLSGHFPAETRLRGSSRESLERTLAATPRDILAGYRLISGHCDTTVTRRLGRMPHFVTVLREPIARLMSRYEMIGRRDSEPLHAPVASGELAFFDWLRHPEGGVAEADLHVRMLAGALDEAPSGGYGRLDRWAVLELARERLDELAFFGILERFDDSVRLASHTFHWESPDAAPHLESSGASHHRFRLSSREIELASEQNQLDLYLYEMARKIFRDRVGSLEKPTPKPGAAIAIPG